MPFCLTSWSELSNQLKWIILIKHSTQYSSTFIRYINLNTRLISFGRKKGRNDQEDKHFVSFFIFLVIETCKLWQLLPFLGVSSLPLKETEEELRKRKKRKKLDENRARERHSSTVVAFESADGGNLSIRMWVLLLLWCCCLLFLVSCRPHAACACVCMFWATVSYFPSPNPNPLSLSLSRNLPNNGWKKESFMRE